MARKSLGHARLERQRGGTFRGSAIWRTIAHQRPSLGRGYHDWLDAAGHEVFLDRHLTDDSPTVTNGHAVMTAVEPLDSQPRPISDRRRSVETLAFKLWRSSASAALALLRRSCSFSPLTPVDWGFRQRCHRSRGGPFARTGCAGSTASSRVSAVATLIIVRLTIDAYLSIVSTTSTARWPRL